MVKIIDNIIILILILDTQLIKAIELDRGGESSQDSNTFNSNNPEPYYENLEADLSQISGQDLDLSLVEKYDRYSDLTTDHLEYSDNYNKIKDKSNLDPKVRDEYLAKQSGKNIKTETSPNTQGGTLPNGGFWFEVIDFLSVDDISLTNGKNVRYENNKVTVDSADTITVQDGELTVVENFDGSDVSFRVDSADNVQIRCLVLDDVINTDFIVLPDRTRAEPDKDTTLFITDCSQTQSSFTSSSEDGRISITEHEPITYTVEDGKVIYESATHRDILETEGLSTITFDYYDGFQCTDMSPKATYFYTDKLDAKRDFAVNNPAFGQIYKLCLRRMQAQSFEDAEGTIDFIENKVTLKQSINYLRYPLTDAEISGLNLQNTYQSYTDVEMIAVRLN